MLFTLKPELNKLKTHKVLNETALEKESHIKFLGLAINPLVWFAKQRFHDFT